MRASKALPIGSRNCSERHGGCATSERAVRASVSVGRSLHPRPFVVGLSSESISCVYRRRWCRTVCTRSRHLPYQNYYLPCQMRVLPSAVRRKNHGKNFTCEIQIVNVPAGGRPDARMAERVHARPRACAYVGRASAEGSDRECRAAVCTSV